MAKILSNKQTRNGNAEAGLERIAQERERLCGFLSLRCGKTHTSSREQVNQALNDIIVSSHF